MRPRNTLILLALAVGIFLFIWIYESKLPSSRDAADRESRVLNVDRDAIDGMIITNNEDRVELRKRNSEWFVEKPVQDRADPSMMAALLTSVESLRKEAVIAEEKGKKPNLKEYGLAKSSLRLKLLGGGNPPELCFGQDAAVEGKVYARLENSDTAFLVGNELKNQLIKKPDEFRDRKLSNLTAAQIKKLAIKTPAGEIELEKANDHWALKRPLIARADDARITDLIAQLLTTRINSFVPDADPAAISLKEPRGTVSFFAEGQEKPAVLKIGQPSKEAEMVYAKLSTRDSSYLLPKKVEEILNLKPADLRDKHLLRENFDIVDRISIEAEGKPRVVLARNREEWMIHSSHDRLANTGEIKRFISDLQNTQVTQFVSDVASDLHKYNLDKPLLKITLSAYASENTAESKAGESPIVAIEFGQGKDGESVFARLDDEPFIVSVPRWLVERVFTDPVQWQDVVIYKSKPDDIKSLEVSKAGQPALTLTRSGKTWQSAKPETKVNATNVQSLLNTLCALRAARWAGSADQGGGESIRLSITFSDGKATHKLSVGTPTPDGMWLATADEVNGSFVLPRPDVEALGLPLVEAPKPESTPAVGDGSPGPLP